MDAKSCGAWLFEIWGTPQIDLFASAADHRLPVYCSLGFVQAAVHHDLLRLMWKGWESYAFSPIYILTKVQAKIRLEKASVILMAQVTLVQASPPPLSQDPSPSL